ncbi:MAG: hypothetical protein HFH49_08455 [Lachnospiraceae bacterium]|nr:hypothetical protein [Lachnospiraceae bacterium]
MKKRYLSLFLAAAIALGQTAGIKQFVQAAELSAEEESEDRDRNLEEPKQYAEAVKPSGEDGAKLEDPSAELGDGAIKPKEREQPAVLEEKREECVNRKEPAQLTEAQNADMDPETMADNGIESGELAQFVGAAEISQQDETGERVYQPFFHCRMKSKYFLAGIGQVLFLKRKVVAGNWEKTRLFQWK